MSALFILVGASLVIAIGFLMAFIWSVKNGQYDDDYTPSIRMLFDNGPPAKKEDKTVPPQKESKQEIIRSSKKQK